MERVKTLLYLVLLALLYVDAIQFLLPMFFGPAILWLAPHKPPLLLIETVHLLCQFIVGLLAGACVVLVTVLVKVQRTALFALLIALPAVAVYVRQLFSAPVGPGPNDFLFVAACAGLTVAGLQAVFWLSNHALQPTVLAFGVALPSQRCALARRS